MERYTLAASPNPYPDVTWRAAAATLKGHIGPVIAVAVFSDGRRAISASWDHTLKVWDLESRRVIVGFSGEGPLPACAVAPDGVAVIAGEVSGPVHFLRLEGV